MKKVLFYIALHVVAVVIVARAAAVHAAVNLAITCPDATQAGLPVPSSCNGGQVYKTPTANDLVRVDPMKTVNDGGGDWSNLTTYRWKKYSAVVLGETFEVCKSNIANPHTAGVSPGDCTQWGWTRNILTGTGVGANAAALSWNVPAQNTDGSALKSPVTYRVYRKIDDAQYLQLATTFANTMNLTRQPAGMQCYYVTAVTPDGESAPSNENCKLLRIGAPSGGTIERPGNGSITPR